MATKKPHANVRFSRSLDIRLCCSLLYYASILLQQDNSCSSYNLCCSHSFTNMYVVQLHGSIQFGYVNGFDSLVYFEEFAQRICTRRAQVVGTNDGFTQT